MGNVNIPLGTRISLALRALQKVLLRPGYFVVVLIGAWLFLGLLVWIINWQLLVTVMFDQSVSLGQKLWLYVQGYGSLTTNFTWYGAVLLVLFALLAGINMSLALFVIRSSIKEALRGSGHTITAIVAAIVGASCAACGTSFIAPLVTGFSASIAIGLTETIGIAANVLGLGMLLYSIVGLSGQAATYISKERYNHP